MFTNHPLTPPAVTDDWSDDPDPGYWTGEASMPRSAQYRRTAVHIYQPAWDEETDATLWSVFPYQPFTHAFVPQDRFDEVRQVGNWTIAAKGGGYIALWSWRTPTFRRQRPGRLDRHLHRAVRPRRRGRPRQRLDRRGRQRRRWAERRFRVLRRQRSPPTSRSSSGRRRGSTSRGRRRRRVRSSSRPPARSSSTVTSSPSTVIPATRARGAPSSTSRPSTNSPTTSTSGRSTSTPRRGAVS